MGSQFEGIYLIDGGNTWIIRNTIQDNGHGIILTSSIPLI